MHSILNIIGTILLSGGVLIALLDKDIFKEKTGVVTKTSGFVVCIFALCIIYFVNR